MDIELQTREQFRLQVLEAKKAELSGQAAAGRTAASVGLGLVPRGYDVLAGEVDLLVSQIAAYYMPSTRKFYVVSSNLSDDALDSLIIHELAHALQDQYEDLTELSRRAASLSPEAETALDYVIEGEASYLTFLHDLEAQGMPLERMIPESINTVLLTSRDLDRADIIESQRKYLAGSTEKERQASLQHLEKTSGFLFWKLLSPYVEGRYVVRRAFVQGGWSSVNQLFIDLPQSTEQMLHPEKSMSPRDEPTRFEIPALASKLGPGWSLVYSDVLGEAGIRAYVEAYQPKLRRQLAAGWDGDRYALYRSKTGEQLVAWWSVWDNGLEAGEFGRALELVPFETFVTGSGKAVRAIQQDGIQCALFVGPQSAVDVAKAYWNVVD